MKSTTFTVICGLLAGSALAGPIEQRASSSLIKTIEDAVYKWRADTAFVSNFLNEAGARDFESQAAFHSAAIAAHAHELNEGVQKAVLDKDLPDTTEVKAANRALVTEGEVDAVVALLEDLTKLNYYKQAALVEKDVAQINFGNSTIEGRCQGILPAVDMYFNAAAKYVQKLGGGDSLFSVRAIRETACSTGPYSIASGYGQPTHYASPPK